MSKTYKNSHFTGEFYDLFVVSLKKQSQFARQAFGPCAFIISIYGNIPALEGSKNKANQSQSLRSWRFRRLYLVVRISYLVSRRGMSVFIWKNKANPSQGSPDKFAGLRPEIRSSNFEIRQLRRFFRMPVARCCPGNPKQEHDFVKQTQF
jgi:hypothetical protein